MKKETISIFLIFLSLFLLGCAPIVRVNKFEDNLRPANQGNIQIYTHTESIPYKYKEIALITVDDEGWERSEQELLDIAVIKAKELGADGLLILSQDKQHDGYVAVSNTLVAVNRRVVRATAIVKIGEKLSKYENDMSSENFSIADELRKLKQLLDDEVITREEFNQQKRKLLSQ